MRTRLGLVVASLLVAALAIELGLRLIGFSRPNFYRVDGFVGARLRPHLEVHDRREGDGLVQTNEFGLRGGPLSRSRSPNTFRVAVLGDSFTEALQVNVEKTYWRVAEAELIGCAALDRRTPEFISFGVSGFSTAQEYLALEHQALGFAPDFVVLQFFAENDVRDNVRALSKNPRRPYLFVENGDLRLDDAFLSESEYVLRRSLFGRAGYAAINQIRILQLVNVAKNELNRPAPNPPTTASRIEDPIYTSSVSGAWAEAWHLTERLIVQTSSLATGSGADFLLMSVSTPIQVQPDASVKSEFMARRGIQDLFAAERRLRRLAQRSDINYLALGPALASGVDATGPYLHGFEQTGTLGRGHWNEAGHEQAGIALARYVCSALNAPNNQNSPTVIRK